MRSDDIVEIVPHLYISNWDTSNNPIELEKNHIKAVLSLETTPKPYEILNYYKTRKISHMYIHIGDLPSENIRKYFVVLLDEEVKEHLPFLCEQK